MKAAEFEEGTQNECSLEANNRLDMSIEDLAVFLCSHYNIEAKVLWSKSKARDVSLVRKVLVWLVYENTDHSLNNVSKYLKRSNASISRMARDFYKNESVELRERTLEIGEMLKC